MFYLLEDNRIIDSRISYTINFPYWEIKDNCLFAKSKNDKLARPCNENKIKKQSENVYDLIDWNEDLVRIDTACGSMMVDCKHAKSDFSDGFYNVEWIKAIYKPNAKGDYMKAWEEKKETNYGEIDNVQMQ